MRAKRPLRRTGPAFDLPQLKSHLPELQVQQKNEQELNKFFIDVDDSTVSPMVTTDPSFRCPSMSNLNSLADLPALDSVTERGKSGETVGSGGKAAGHTEPTFSASPVVNPSSQQGEAKFIHVNNTNIFVLIDGISMFVEGKSTFTGTEDARLLTERLRQKRLAARSVDTVQEAILNIEMSPDGCVHDVTAPVRAPALGPNPSRHDTGMASAPFAAGEPAGGSTQNNSSNSHFLHHGPQRMLPRRPNTGTRPTSNFATLPLLPSPATLAKSFAIAPEWAALFADAKKPVDSPLFRTFKANSFASCSASNASVRVNSASTILNGHSNGGNNPAGLSRSISSPLGAPPGTPATSVTPTSLVSPSNANGFNGCGKTVPHSPSSQSLRHHESSSSLVSMMSGASHTRHGNKPKARPISVDDIGHSNRSLDMDEVSIEELIGKGTQGTVFRVRVDGKVYALKCMNIDEAMNATNDVERQGRKKGLVKELTMISLQRARPPPEYLTQMFNAVASLDAEKKQLSILLELMSFTVENIQQMMSRIPKEELMGIAQSTFRKYMSGDATAKKLMMECRANQAQYGSSRHAVGRSVYNEAASWEKQVERSTPLPEVLLSMLAHDVLKGLNELHTDYSIVHCDLKPANVLLCYDMCKFKLADFGCGCVMDDGCRVERRGIDLGSMLYKAPERFSGSILHRDSEADDGGVGEAVVEFTAKADVWSLGIMLLELAAGVHPCEQFKSNFWDYGSMLKLAKMNKPLNWSEPFYDFILRTVCVDASKRWSVQQLLRHPFIVNFNYVPREKLKQFVQRMDADSKTFHKRQQSELLREQILLSTTRRHKDTYRLQSEKRWAGFTAYLKRAPPTMDQKIFPQLRHT